MDDVPKKTPEQEMQVVRLVLGRDALADSPQETLVKDLKTLNEHKEYIQQCIDINKANLEKVEERITEYTSAIETMPQSPAINAFRFV